MTHLGLIMRKAPLIGVTIESFRRKCTTPTRIVQFPRLSLIHFLYITRPRSAHILSCSPLSPYWRPCWSRNMSTPQSEDNYILQLPPETLLHIASYIDKPVDLISLAHTNSVLRSYAVSKLYSRICLYRWSAKTIDVLDHLIR